MNGSNEVFVSWRITNESIIDNKTSWHVVWSFQLLKTLQSTAPERWVHCMLTRSTLKSTDISAISNSLCIRPKQFFHATFFLSLFFPFRIPPNAKSCTSDLNLWVPLRSSVFQLSPRRLSARDWLWKFQESLKRVQHRLSEMREKIGRQDLGMLLFEGGIRDRRSISWIRI